jgi:RimJ/RimL family protein N-acetyltransferase
MSSPSVPAAAATPALDRPLLDPRCIAPVDGDRVRLRLVERTDLQELLLVHCDDEVTRFLPYKTWQAMTDAEQWYERAMTRHDARTALQFVIVEQAAQRVAGTCLLFNPVEESRRAEVGYVLGRRDWGRGLMGEALTLLLDLAFGPLQLRRLEAEVDPRNTASNRLALRLGFTREGTLRRRWLTKGEEKDTHIYGLLVDEWQARRAAAAPHIALNSAA